jgi:excisionase family DNA binding protein
MPAESLAIAPAEPSVVGPLYTTQEVARLLRVSQRTVQEWVRAGELTAVRYGRLLRIRQTDLAAFGQVLNPRPAARAEAGE